eukprot:5387702-Prymnesium_polylepis.1
MPRSVIRSAEAPRRAATTRVATPDASWEPRGRRTASPTGVTCCRWASRRRGVPTATRTSFSTSRCSNVCRCISV